jgi:hypothetical protein
MTIPAIALGQVLFKRNGDQANILEVFWCQPHVLGKVVPFT